MNDLETIAPTDPAPIEDIIARGIETIVRGGLTVPEFREKLVALECDMSRLPGAKIGDDVAPLEHSFGDGLYRRTIHMPKGMWLTSKIHKMKHFFFITKGACIVWDEKGSQLIEAPYEGITLPGTKRLLYILQDCTWTTCHNLGKLKVKIEKDALQFLAKACEGDARRALSALDWERFPAPRMKKELFILPLRLPRNRSRKSP